MQINRIRLSAYLRPSKSPYPPSRGRPLLTQTASLNLDALNTWINSNKSSTSHDTFRPEHLSNLYITLPTRDGIRKPYVAPNEGDPVGYGHHLAFFNPRSPEDVLRKDGTDATFSPPEPFTRRMWAGGRLEWKATGKDALLIGDKARAVSTVTEVATKNVDKDVPMVFVKQQIQVFKEGRNDPAVEEERSHVYLAAPASRRATKQVTDLPDPQFSFEYLPSPTTLFRFSALTFNGHYIHLDKEYAQNFEGYPERLVHGPLSALMLLEVVSYHFPDVEIKSFAYRAHNPIIVNTHVRLHGAWEDEQRLRVWAEVDGVVGMSGKVQVAKR